MSTDDENIAHLPDLPAKLASRINNVAVSPGDDETIVGNGEIELTSEHPVSVVEYFLAVHVDEWSESTYKDYSYDLTRFLEYCEYADHDDLTELSSRNLQGFKQWRKRDENVGLASLHGQLANIRVFIRWCEKLELVDVGLADEMDLPDLDPSDIVSHTRLEQESAERILKYHQQFDYVTREFAEFALMWAVLTRLGGVRSLDLDNYDRDEGFIVLEHRPEEGTPLKNGESEVEGEGGEREINLPEGTCDILNTYIDGAGDPNQPKRIEVEDEHGRKPLFTTKYGRVSESTLRRDLYRVTQPCRYGQSCPHGIDPATCENRNDNDLISKCPFNVSPHPVRRGGICYQLKQGVPKDTICERADVSRKVLNKHYDLRTKEEARQQRRDELRKHLEGYEDAPQETNKDSSLLRRELPLVADLVSVKDKYLRGSRN
ncbi:tyrosine-type recombinase/integrase [Halostella pelagica]|uniref:tyrosine-type recombinase/integrase n=1 Tax=Halostella pelagica TaxID=2583824 RepID=UPI001080C14D|nr:site-specific integrase [Halostella pelagica]